MKKLFIALAVAAALASSCNLDERPARVTAENLAADKTGAEKLVVGIYSYFWESYLMTKTYWEWVEYDQDLTVGAAWALSTAGAGNFGGHWGYNSDSDPFLTFYVIISRCNSAIYALQSADLSDDNIAQRYGETLFLRAFAYFHLVRMYGSVPLRLDMTSENDWPRSSVPDVYAQIERDLQEAISYMKYYGSGAVGGWGHADKTAAQILLARVYCTMASGKLAGDGVQMYVNIFNQTGQETSIDPLADPSYQLQWTSFTTQKVMGNIVEDGYSSFDAQDLYGKAAVVCDSVIARRGLSFDLLNDWADLWGGNKIRNKEFVWGFTGMEKSNYRTEGGPYYTTPNSWGGGGIISISDGCWKMYNYDITPGAVNDDRAAKGVWHYWRGNADQWVRFPSGDMRYDTAPDGKKPDSSAEYVKDATTDNTWVRGAAFSNKYYWSNISDPAVVYSAHDNAIAQDIVMIRFSDAWLLRAEARNETGNPAGALDDLNVIRDRVHAAPYNTTDKVLLRSHIFQERGLEFVMEHTRRFDLLRWGMYLNVMNSNVVSLSPHHNEVISRVREAKSLLCPFPTSEMNQNHLFGGNNPGW
ncbi:membrane protein [Bacteroidia bacterium]|nr:membrane protein [Bacteroidia bacterium]